MMGAPGYGVKILVQNSAPGNRRHMSIMKSHGFLALRSAFSRESKDDVEGGANPAARQRAALS